MFITHTQGGRTLKIWTQTLIIYRFCFSIFNQGIWALGSDENILGVSGSLGLPSPVSVRVWLRVWDPGWRILVEPGVSARVVVEVVGA